MSGKLAPIVLVAALLGGFLASTPATATYHVAFRTGTIQSINVLKHTLTINGYTYKVSPKATYVGSLGLSVLSAGTKIRYFLASAKSGQSQIIVRIIVLP